MMTFNDSTNKINKLTSRRGFIRSAAGLVTGLCLPSYLSASELSTQEQENYKAAKYKMIFASPYDTEQWQSSPHMHYQIKKNIESFSDGQIYVEIHDKGVLGVGTELMAKIARGSIHSGLVSVSNLSPVAPVLDILNIPFWSSNNQDYLNLITSNVWKKHVIETIQMQKKLDILFHYIPGARTVTSTKMNGRTFRVPEDIQDIIFRIPSSKILRILYQLLGTSPVNVKWKDVSKSAQIGRIDAIDPSIVGLYNGPDNLKQHIGVVSQINSVQDGWINVVNQSWFNALPLKLKHAVKDAANKTFIEHLESVQSTAMYCKQGLEQQGTKFYLPNESELALWKSVGDHHKPEWLTIKRKLLGHERVFEDFYEATQTNNGFFYGQ